MTYQVIPGKDQKPGALAGGFWVVLQAWPIANKWTIALQGPEGMKIDEGYGEWGVTPVPRDVGITEWKGRRNYKASLDLLYDGWQRHPMIPALPAAFTSRPALPVGVKYAPGPLWVEQWIADLEELALAAKGDPAPHSVRIYGAVPHPEVRWVIENLEFGDAIRDKWTGRRMRQQVTVKLLEYNQPSGIIKLPRPPPQPPFKVKKDKDKRRPWTVTTKVGKVVARFSTQKAAVADCKKRIAAAQKKKQPPKKPPPKKPPPKK